MKITKQQIKEIISEEMTRLNEASMMLPRPRDMFEKTVYWRDLVQVEKTTKTGRKKVDFERVMNSGIIEAPSQDAPDGGLPGYRETRSALLSPDQPIVVTTESGERVSTKANGQIITLLDLMSDAEVKELQSDGEL